MNEVAISPLFEITNLDFDKVLKTAVDIFTDQAGLDKPAEDITLKDLEISKAKAHNFLDAISGIIEIGHQVEILSAENDKFKRSEEMKVLNSLRRSCEMASGNVESTLEMATKRITQLRKDYTSAKTKEDKDSIEASIFTMQAIINCDIDAGQKLIASMSRLIQLERMSGSRPYGATTRTSSNINLIRMDDPKGGNSRKAPREITPEDVQDYTK